MIQGLLAFVALLPVHVSGAGPVPVRQTTPAERYNRAIESFEARELTEARAILAALLEEQPRYFGGYDFFWEVYGKTTGEGALEPVVAAHLEFFDSVPVEERSEDYYSAYLSGCEMLGREDKSALIRTEASKRFPRGLVAQSARMDAAHAEQDPVRAVALIDAFLADFSENVSWAHKVAAHKFRLVMDHPDKFAPDAGPHAAEQLDSLADAYARTYGRLSRRLIDLRLISEAFLAVEPDRALEYADRARTYILKHAEETEEFDRTAASSFHPLRMRAFAALGDWEEVCALGNELLPTPETTIHDEAVLRRLCAAGLEHTGRVEAARLELARAAVIDAQVLPELEEFLAEHPLEGEQLAAFEAQTARFRELRRTLRRKALMATGIRRPAPGFTLPDLAGVPVSLASLRGRVVVIDFWATWCMPCLEELEDMRPVAEEFAANDGVVFVAVSVDSEKHKVAPFVKDHGYPFQVLISDGSVEKPYETQSIPQLYVLDARGQIRFHRSGYHRENFRQDLRWMIEAASD